VSTPAAGGGSCPDQNKTRKSRTELTYRVKDWTGAWINKDIEISGNKYKLKVNPPFTSDWKTVPSKCPSSE